MPNDSAAPARPQVLSVNVGRVRPSEHSDAPNGLTAIDKRPADGPVAVTAPGPKGTAGSALAGDAIGDWRHHGGTYQAVYAFAREDLDRWAGELGRVLPAGSFGENLTTHGIDVNAALIGERWRIGPEVLLEVCSVRIPCRTFAAWLDERGWVKRFTRDARPGAYLRVIEPGEIRAGDPVEVVHRPSHDLTVRRYFQACTLVPELRPGVLAALDALAPDEREQALRWAGPPVT
jgi:MOSC domain-containing protein YiiM